MPFGILDTQYIDLPAGIDRAYLEGLRTRAGVDFSRILRELDSRLGALNGGMDSLLATLLAPPTTEETADTSMPMAFEVNERGEYTFARPQYVEGAAHMLSMRHYDVSLGFTEDGLETMSLGRITLNIDSLFLGMRKLYRKEILKRLFSDAEVRISVKTSASSPGFAGSGTGTNVFSGTYPDGTPLPGGYTHYFRDTAANLAAILRTALTRLRRWSSGPFDIIGSQSMIDAIVALGEPDFVLAGSPLIRLGSGSNEALVDGSTYVGVFDKDARVRLPVTDFTDPNIVIYKSYGALRPGNALVWKYDEIEGRNAVVRSRSLYPLDNAVLKQGFGVNVANRVAAALIRIDAAGGYVPPTLV